MTILPHATAHRGRAAPLARGLPVPIAVAALVSAIAVVLGASAAAAQTGPATDYGSYPPALPAGCPDVPAALEGLRWATSTGGDSTELATLGLRPGDTVTASWAAFGPGCVDADGAPRIIFSLAAYEGGATPFDPLVDQSLLAGWASCGPGVGECERSGDRYSLEVSLPSSGACAAQLDLVIGPPLAVVGPSGSYFSSVARNDNGPNLLIASGSPATSPCAAPVVTVPVSQPAVDVTSPPDTTAPTAATSPVTVEPTPATVSAGATTAPPAVSAEALAVSPAQLPVTGRDTRSTAAVAVIIAIIGAGLIAISLRRPVAR
jgi:hypothetical protein